MNGIKATAKAAAPLSFALASRCARRQRRSEATAFQLLVDATIYFAGSIRPAMIIIGSRADPRGANNPLKRSSLHLQGLLRSPAGSCLRLASPLATRAARPNGLLMGGVFFSPSLAAGRLGTFCPVFHSSISILSTIQRFLFVHF